MKKGDHLLNKKGTIAKNVVKEPVVDYPPTPKSKRLTISSLAGQEQDNYLYWITLSPSQRIAHVTELIKKVYADQLRNPGNTPKRIIFDKT